jgi:prevent-host-death family protein
MINVNMHEAKSNLSKLVRQVEAGEEVIVSRAGQPVAKIVPYSAPAKKPRIPGSMKGTIWIAPDFDEIPEEFEEYLP